MSQTELLNRQPLPRAAEAARKYANSPVSIHRGYAEDHYAHWPSPTCIVSDGPYGVDGFPGDTRTAASLADWYEPHIEAWSAKSTPETTL